MMKQPNEKKIARYMREDPKFNPVAYRKAWHRTGRIIEQRKQTNEKK